MNPFTQVPLPEDEALKVLQEVMKDRTTILQVHINIPSAWYLISALQTTARHPGIGKALARKLEETGRQFQNHITELYPQAGPVLEMGWHEQFDVEVKNGKESHD